MLVALCLGGVRFTPYSSARLATLTRGKADFPFLSRIAGQVMPETATDQGADEKAGADLGGRAARGAFLSGSVSTRNIEGLREMIPSGVFFTLKERFISLQVFG